LLLLLPLLLLLLHEVVVVVGAAHPATAVAAWLRAAGGRRWLRAGGEGHRCLPYPHPAASHPFPLGVCVRGVTAAKGAGRRTGALASVCSGSLSTSYIVKHWFSSRSLAHLR